ncbi:6,7-dimethyl-8-ribityllumazine synthase [Candidatus Protochlamydia sp. W-9]|uniref:6,7-dimethyl-8-ribityllumazine synthase n=1 Tax=Candidatus Protochlamydia sp. W-9 TaxID=1785087 RepID=UPI00096A8D3B|nr:6,7-dimethyl-8-ribityllumazine synthase [Candidatus Protochlamydia sp. W-9]
MKEYKGKLNISKARIGIVISRFNEAITKNLLEGSLDELERYGISTQNLPVAWVPGAFEIPLIAKQMALSGEFDAIICLGAIIRGTTPHFDYVASQSAAGILNVSLEINLPVVFGILTTDTVEQAMERSGVKMGNKGREAVQTAIEMIDLTNQLSLLRDRPHSSITNNTSVCK